MSYKYKYRNGRNSTFFSILVPATYYGDDLFLELRALDYSMHASCGVLYLPRFPIENKQFGKNAEKQEIRSILSPTTMHQ